MTATIRPFVPTINNDEKARFNQYCKAIEFYITKSPFTDIIFAENSDYDFSDTSKHFSDLAAKYDKRFEYLSLDKPSGVNIGTAEALLMKQALNRSDLIQKYKWNNIWKITGRIKVKNIEKIVLRSQKHDNVFFFSTKYPCDWCRTYLFKVSLQEFQKLFLSESTLTELNKEAPIENVFCHLIYREKLCVHRFPQYPQIEHIVNSGGGDYASSGIRLFFHNCLLFMGFNSMRKG